MNGVGRRTGWAGGAVLLALLTLGACQAQAPAGPGGTGQRAEQPLAVTLVHAGNACGTEAASVQALAKAESLLALVDRPVGGPPARAPAVDFDRQSVLRVSMGLQPSAGARFAVRSASVDTATRRVTIHMDWQPPDPRAAQAAVISQPCVVVALPRGDYASVQVLDQAGQRRLSGAWAER